MSREPELGIIAALAAFVGALCGEIVKPLSQEWAQGRRQRREREERRDAEAWHALERECFDCIEVCRKGSATGSDMERVLGRVGDVGPGFASKGARRTVSAFLKQVKGALSAPTTDAFHRHRRVAVAKYDKLAAMCAPLTKDPNRIDA